MSEQKDNLHYQHQYAEDLENEKMSEIQNIKKRLKSVQEVLSNIFDLIDNLINEVKQLEKDEERKNIGVSMTEQQGMIVVSVSVDGKRRSQYTYEDWTQVFRQLLNEEEFKR